MTRKSDLLRLLATIPGDPLITNWLPPAARATREGCESDIEEAVIADNIHDGGRVVVLGMDIDTSGMRGVERIAVGK